MTTRKPPNPTGVKPKVLEFIVPQLPPKELFPNQAKPGPGWNNKAWYGRQASIRDMYGRWVYEAALVAMRGKALQETPWEIVLWQPLPQVRLILTFISPDHRRRDTDNLLAAFKRCGIDTLVKAGVMADDGPDCVRELVSRAEYDAGYPQGAVHVKVEEWVEPEKEKP